MNESYTDGNCRAISVIALIQTVVIVGGTLVVAGMMKAYGYGREDLPYTFSQSAIFIRQHGFVLLLIPSIWALAAIYIVRSTWRPWLPSAIIWIGISLVVVSVGGYIHLGTQPPELVFHSKLTHQERRTPVADPPRAGYSAA